ncbi:hypothetical protein [Rhizobium leguminosarum]|uniref:Uncharacterized protein n=1 Tax=Rhizobium leguminosarum TaxID=384 RepID=A0A7M3DQM4_RHILE|nr:hypothetical protein [Rhizobium leguminosarum]TAY50930.1 hypothetical protein ELH90_04005 [Rhizobium leguminosarum]
MRRLLVLLTLIAAGSAAASEQDAKLSRLAWSAFECHELALIADNQPEKVRLFRLGSDASTKFSEAVRAGKVSDIEMFNFVPGGMVDIVRSTDAPSAEFVVGRIYQLVVVTTFEWVTQKDSGGKALPPDKWVVDPLEMKGIAQTKYRQANCELIK